MVSPYSQVARYLVGSSLVSSSHQSEASNRVRSRRSDVSKLKRPTAALVMAGLLGVAAPALHAAEPRAAAAKVIDRLRPMVFQLVTAIGPDAPWAGHGTAFVVSHDGLLATNYHVVSTSLEKKGYDLYLLDADRRRPARVVRVDTLNDLALVKVERKFSAAVVIADEPPDQGDDIYSIGFPLELDLTITEGTYNGVTEYDPYARIHATLPLNPGMSGGPVTNGLGVVVGVNVAGRFLMQQVNAAVPAAVLRVLIRRTDVIGKSFSLGQSVAEQAAWAQMLLTDGILDAGTARGEPTQQVFAGWQLPAIPKGLECDAGLIDTSDGEGRGLGCQLPAFRWLPAPSYRFFFAELSGNLTNEWTKLRAQAGGGRGRCSTDLVENQYGARFWTRICGSYQGETRHWNATLTFVSLGSHDDLLGGYLSLRSFAAENARLVISKWLDGIQRLGDT